MPIAVQAARRAASLIAVCLLPLSLVACGGGSGDDAAPTSSTAARAAGFPRTIEHKLGTTEIPAQPRRVVALGPAERDLVAALDVELVGAGVQLRRGARPEAPPWLEPELRDGKTQLLALDRLPFERIAALRPDLILAQSGEQGVTATEYRKLSQIAPTVAYREGAAVDSWQDVSRTAGEALGLEEQAKALVARAETRLSETAKAHPAFEGATFMVSNVFAPDQFGALISDEVSTVRVLRELGFALSPNAGKVDKSPEGGPIGMISRERVELLDADVLFLNYAVPPARRAFEANPLYQRMDVVGRDAVVQFTPDEWSALRDNSVLSVPYLLDHLTPRLGKLDLGDPAA